jgi:hypothetical protein
MSKLPIRTRATVLIIVVVLSWAAIAAAVRIVPMLVSLAAQLLESTGMIVGLLAGGVLILIAWVVLDYCAHGMKAYEEESRDE